MKRLNGGARAATVLPVADAPQGPGWWQASDGQFYAPELHPDYRPPVAGPETGGYGQPGPGQGQDNQPGYEQGGFDQGGQPGYAPDASGPPAYGPPDHGPQDVPPPASDKKRNILIAAGVAVVAALIAGGVVLANGGGGESGERFAGPSASPTQDVTPSTRPSPRPTADRPTATPRPTTTPSRRPTASPRPGGTPFTGSPSTGSPIVVPGAQARLNLPDGWEGTDVEGDTEDIGAEVFPADDQLASAFQAGADTLPDTVLLFGVDRAALEAGADFVPNTNLLIDADLPQSLSLTQAAAAEERGLSGAYTITDRAVLTYDGRQIARVTYDSAALSGVAYVYKESGKFWVLTFVFPEPLGAEQYALTDASAVTFATVPA